MVRFGYLVQGSLEFSFFIALGTRPMLNKWSTPSYISTIRSIFRNNLGVGGNDWAVCCPESQVSATQEKPWISLAPSAGTEDAIFTPVAISRAVGRNL